MTGERSVLFLAACGSEPGKPEPGTACGGGTSPQAVDAVFSNSPAVVRGNPTRLDRRRAAEKSARKGASPPGAYATVRSNDAHRGP